MVMARPKKKPEDKHKNPQFQLRLHPLLRQQLQKSADRNATTITEEARTALRKYLESVGLWPIPEK